jgi:hypothetical protein
MKQKLENADLNTFIPIKVAKDEIINKTKSKIKEI